MINGKSDTWLAIRQLPKGSVCLSDLLDQKSGNLLPVAPKNSSSRVSANFSFPFSGRVLYISLVHITQLSFILEFLRYISADLLAFLDFGTRQDTCLDYLEVLGRVHVDTVSGKLHFPIMVKR